MVKVPHSVGFSQNWLANRNLISYGNSSKSGDSAQRWPRFRNLLGSRETEWVSGLCHELSLRANAHTQELELAIWQANHANVEKHIIVDIDLRPFGGSALTDPNLLVPKFRDMETMVQSVPDYLCSSSQYDFPFFCLGMG